LFQKPVSTEFSIVAAMILENGQAWGWSSIALTIECIVGCKAISAYEQSSETLRAMTVIMPFITLEDNKQGKRIKGVIHERSGAL